MNEEFTTLLAGAAKIDITPPAGVQLAGDIGVRRAAELIGDPLFARAIVFELGGRKLCIVALDVTIITRRHSEAIRRLASEKGGIEPDAVMVHATQTHSAPSIGHFMMDEDFEVPSELDWARGGDERYNPFAVERIAEAIRQACEALRPVQIGVASGIEGRWAHNRRGVMRDGKVCMPYRHWTDPLGPRHVKYLEGPIDPELGVLAIRTDTLELLALMVNYTCHPIHVFPKPILSADWPGALCDALNAMYGPDCIPLTLNGACGNINPWPPYDPDYIEDHERMGSALAATARNIVETIRFEAAENLDFRVRRIGLAFRELDAARMEEVRRILEADPEPPWDEDGKRIRLDWMFAAWDWSLELQRRREGVLEYEIQVFRIGDTAFVSLPGEPFVEGQLRIKLASPAPFTYIVHCTTQYVGYIPTAEAYGRGGHEVVFCKVTPESLDAIVETAVQLLWELFPAPSADG